VCQVFPNLVANAFKFSRLAARPFVEIAVDAQGAFIVRDNGIGFEPREALAIFQPFTRMTSDAACPGSGVSGCPSCAGCLRATGLGYGDFAVRRPDRASVLVRGGLSA
jgi:light-regulated signal transduction histidine kinase (bacteriophytochrome)